MPPKSEETAAAELPTATEAQSGKKAKQGRLPGMQPKSIVELEEAMQDYDEVVSERMEMTEKEIESKHVVLGLMKKHKQPSYKYGGFVWQNTTKDELKRKRVKKEAGE